MIQGNQPGKKAYSMTWACAQRLKRVFAIDPNAARSRSVRSAVARQNVAREIIVSIEDPLVIANVSNHSDSEASWPG